jgi:xylulokinase
MSLMGLDIGTTGTKAVVFDESGQVLASHYREYPLYIPQKDQCELEPSEVWDAIREVISTAACHVKGSDPIQAIGISTLGDSVTPLDETGTPLYRTVVGAADRRAVKEAAWLEKKIGRKKLFKKTGAPLHAFCTIPKIIWFRENKPEVFERASKFTGWQEILHLKFDANPAMDYSLASRTMLVNMHTQEWEHGLLNTSGITTEKFFPLAWSKDIVGQIEHEQLGLERGVKIATGGFDQCCCAMGAGVLESGTAALTVGTLEALTAIYDTCRIEQPLLEGNHGCGIHVVQGLYFSLAYVTTSGAVLRWYRDNLGIPEVTEAQKQNRDPYELILEPIPDRPSSVYILPYFTGTGTPWLDVSQRGSIFGLTLDTDRAEIVKGLLDGICYEVKINVESLGNAGISIHRFRAIGGGAKSDKWMQLKADITGIPVETTKVTEAGCLGAAFLAGLGTGVYSSTDDIKKIVAVDRVFEPRKDISTQYKEGYKVYKELRSRVEGLQI